jgi:hypothetical protein
VKLTAQEKIEYWDRYLAASKAARSKWVLEHPEHNSLGFISEIEAHPNTIDKLLQCCNWCVDFIDNQHIAEDVILFGVTPRGLNTGSTRNGAPL